MTAQQAYDYYFNALKNGVVTADTIKQAYGELDPFHVQRTLNIKKELDLQQKAGSAEYWSAGQAPSLDNATWDMAFRLSEGGITSLQDIGKRTNTVEVMLDETGQTGTQQQTEYINKKTGEAIPNWNHLSQSHSSGLKLDYNLHFTDDGTVIPYTTKKTSDWVQFRDNVVKPVGGILLAAYGIPALSPYVSAATGLATGTAGLTAATSAVVSGGTSLLSGNSMGDALKSALVSGISAGATAGYADTIGQSLGFDAGSVASKAAGHALIGAAKAGVTDENVLQGLVTGAVSSILSNKDGVIKAADEDLAAGLNPEYGSNQTYDAFMSEAMKNTNTYLAENQDFATDEMGRAGQFGNEEFDATAREGSLAKLPTDEGLNLTAKDFKTAVKIGGVLLAGNEVVDKTIGSSTSSFATKPDKDIYRDAPLAGFKMVKYEDAATGSSKYIPFVGEEALLPPPTGYTKTSYAKGGFVSKRK